MHPIVLIELPVKNPVIIFVIILLTILLIPLVSKRIGIPGIVGMIISGVIFGPKGINLLGRDASIELFSTVGLLYIMFIAGLEIDMEEFRKSRNRSIIYGITAFVIPISLGYTAAFYLLRLDLLSSILLSAMFASHTLLTYPAASKLGLSQSRSVIVTVGSTIITDILALLTLAVIIGIRQGEMTGSFWIRIIAGFAVLVLLVFFVLPRLTAWFFRGLETDGEQQFIYVLAALFLSASLAQAAGLEPIIGAFFAGLAINSYIPSTSPLMNRILFVGNTIFIPFFLISVGMLVDVRSLYSSTETWIVAILMTVISLSSKFIAAFFVQNIYKYTSLERNVMFGLSSAQAAATLAIVLIALRAGMFSNDILNGTIFMILVTSLTSSFIVDKAGRKLALQQEKGLGEAGAITEKILIPVARDESIEPLVDFAAMIQDPVSDEPLTALKVVDNTREAPDEIMKNRKVLDRAILHASATEKPLRVISRIDSSIANGIIRAVRELLITDVVLDWRGEFRSRNRIFGNILDQLITDSGTVFYFCRMVHPVNTINKITVLMPERAEYEKGFQKWLLKMRMLAKQTGAVISFFGNYHGLSVVRKELEEGKPAVQAEYNTVKKLVALNLDKDGLSKDDLFVLVSARRKSISWDRSLDRFPRRFVKEYPDVNFITLYPEQH
ncbi:MAG: cation:proton antiporter [Ignavibacteria bacterium]|jgi:Kef-type K+ transport system membrane component KefB|nr:cation:proton antiporter [Ignavibacteria bacterium]MCU7504390.1 cation:proton antiporter [Ignavibacteria bacterium]MCU7517613.1 cation:proton antiporter [Ignavibacteria bacterium]